MKRAFLIASFAALILAPGRARAQAASAISQVLCTNDSISVTRNSKSLVEGLHSEFLTWSASPSNPDYYNVYRSLVSGGPYARIASCIQQLSYTDNASSGQDLFYVVTAVSGAQESVNSNEVEAQVPVFDSISVIPNLQALPTESLTTSAALTVRQTLQRSASESLNDTVSITLAVRAPGAAALSLSLHTSDAFSASQALGRGAIETLSSSDSIVVSKSSTAPGQLGSPFWLTTVATALPPQVTLNWTQSVSPGIGGSNIYRHGQQGGPYYLLKVSPFPITHFVDFSALPGVGYCYVVTGLTGNFESPYSNEACSTPPVGVSPPSALTVGIRQGVPLLTWRQSATRKLTGNNLYRSMVSGGPYTLLHSFSSPATSFSDATAARGQAYFYVVTAVAGSQESGYSNQAATVVP